MEKDLLEKMYDSFEKTFEKFEKKVDGNFEKIFSKFTEHDKDIRELQVNQSAFNKSIEKLFEKQEEAIKWQSTLIDKISSANKQNLTIAISLLLAILAIAGFGYKVL